MKAISSRARAWLATGLCVFAVASCNLAADSKLDIPDGKDLIPTTKIEVKAALRSLFPSLSDEEISSLTGKLSASDVLALRAELEEVRKSVAKFSADLFQTAEERVETRRKVLAEHNDGYPEGVAAIGEQCTYDAAAKRGEIRLSGVFDSQTALTLTAETVQLRVDGATQAFDLNCLAGGPSVDIVFLIDITGSMSNVIASVRDSVVSFVDRIEEANIRGTLSVVTYQDSVGVQRTFQEPAPSNNYERSPFFKPVDLDSASDVTELRKFVNRLEANRGADAPENLSAAIDFARNNVIGYDSKGQPNVIGDGREDPAGTAAFPALPSERQVFVVLTDITFHGDDRTASNSSLLAPFVPRDAAEVLASLRETGTTVHVSDPSWVDEDSDPKRHPVDADYWAEATGGVGRDRVEGYSLVDLELVVVAKESGLLDIALDKVIQSSCALSFEAELKADAKVELGLSAAAGGSFSTHVLDVIRF